MTDSVHPRVESSAPLRSPRSVPRFRAARPASSLGALVQPGRRLEPAPSQALETASRAPLPGGAVRRYLALGAALSGLLVGEVALRRAAQSSLESRADHGSAGVKHTQKGVDVRWRQARTKVYLDSSIDSLGGDAREAVRSAFATWSSADPELPAIEFERASNEKLKVEPDGRNTVIVAPITVKGHEHDLAITLTYSDEQRGDIIEADIIVNAEYPFRTLTDRADGDDDNGDDHDGNDKDAAQGKVTQLTVNAARASCTASAQRAACAGNSYDLQNVVTHEVGHFYGLAEDMEDPATTMYYCTSRCETHKRVLTPSDAQVITSLYSASPESADSAPGCGGARMAPRGGLREAGIALLISLAALARRRRGR